MKLDKHVVDMFTELTKPADDVKMEKTCYGTISVVDGTRYVKLDGSDLLVPAASTVKTSHGDRVTVLMKNHSLTITGNLTAPATDGEGGSSGEAGTAATIEVGTVTTGEAGSSASVTNSGTASAAIFDFVIPRGDKGEKGDTGPQGPQGEKGDTGTWDGTIPDHQHAVSDITDFPTSLPANGGDADTLGGKDSTDFVQNHKSYISEGSIKDFLLTSNSGCAFVSPNVTDMPIDGYTWWFLRIERPEGSHIAAYAANIGNSAEYRIIYNAASDSWSDWIAINDGGNADTVDGLHANEIASNPNLLINPDFKINQRGYQIYHAYGGQPSTETEKFDADYFADGWKFMFGGETAEITNDGVTLTLVNNQGVQQRLNFDMLRSLRGKPVVFSIDWELESGNYANFAFRNGSTLNSIVSTSDIGRKSQHFTAIIPTDLSETDAHTVTISGDGIIKVYSVKMEVGSIATQFVPPSHATELLKIQAMDGTIPADTLDGKHASDFALKTDIPTSLPANGGNADTVDGKHADDFIYARGYFNSIDLDDIKYPCSALALNCVHSPFDMWGTLLVYAGGTGSFTQIYIPTANNGTPTAMYFRHYGGTGWTTWRNTADGGNADTLDGLHANEIASNPNLLINPDFKINQRGKSVYSGKTYTVDGWKCIRSAGQVTVGDSGITISNTAGGECKIQNFIERDLTGKTITLSACIDGTIHKVSGVATTDMATWSKQLKVYFDGRGGYLLFGSHQASPPIFFVMIESSEEKSYNIQWVKLELGGIATPFTPTDPATELVKCQRYYQIRSTNTISTVDLSPSMRIAPTVTQIGSSRYAYSAEL